MKKLPLPDCKALFEAVSSLQERPRSSGYAKLRVKDLGEYRIRVRVYRIRYDIDDERRIVYALAVKHRGQAYRT
jgi:mRNA-degrading endonuclease RelE of RelBE toxin-antitoxin system